MMNTSIVSVVCITWMIVMLGLCYSESVKDTARYCCIAEVSKTQDFNKAKELCK